MLRVIVRPHQRNNRATRLERNATAVNRIGFAGFSISSLFQMGSDGLRRA